MSESLRSRLARLTVDVTTRTLLSRSAFVDFVPVTIEEGEYCEHTPSDCGFVGFIVIRATSRERYNAKKAELVADGWHLLEC